MKNRIICVVACMMMLVGCLGLCSCGNYRVFNTTDYEGDQLQITIDGTTYLVHAANAIMKT